MKRSPIGPKTFAEALEKRLAQPQKPRKRGYEWKRPRKALDFKGRKRLTSRRPNKGKTVDGDSPRAIKDECDQLVRDIIALRDCSCVTCNRGDRVLHVGHLFRRGLESVRWNLLNCNAQCDPCNVIHETEPLHYQMWFRFVYGNVAYDVLEIASRSKHKFKYIELGEIRDGLRAELKRYEAAQKARAA